jgi:hypothetical protein
MGAAKMAFFGENGRDNEDAFEDLLFFRFGV